MVDPTAMAMNAITAATGGAAAAGARARAPTARNNQATRGRRGPVGIIDICCFLRGREEPLGPCRHPADPASSLPPDRTSIPHWVNHPHVGLDVNPRVGVHVYVQRCER